MESMIHVVPVWTNIREFLGTAWMNVGGFPGTKRIQKIAYGRLLLVRLGSAEESLGSWYFQRSVFGLIPITPCIFDLESSTIENVDDGNFKDVAGPPADFPKLFWDTIDAWVGSSIKRREEIVNDLRLLNVKCISEAAKY
jgi:hypothetical protein